MPAWWPYHSFTYKHGAATDDLSYAYDEFGRRTAVFGTLARTGLPPAATTSYEAANRIPTWNGATASTIPTGTSPPTGPTPSPTTLETS